MDFNETGITKRNYRLGISIIIIGFFTLALYPSTIFIGSELHKINMETTGFYFAAFLGFMILVSGILYLVSLIFNIKESRKVSNITKGLKLTLISTIPVALCYIGIMIKALTEGH
ncbi:MAG: hypothetical protein M1409_02845 [Actinobacteria bacterium]|nr:hypothetical protein [Actinomycetota bacterium]